MIRCVAVVVLCLCAASRGGVVEYNGDTFPEKEGWERLLAGTDGAVRSLQDGLFIQFVDRPPGVIGPFGNAEFYQRSLADFADTSAFFIEWRVQTDVPSSVLDAGATPVVISAFGSGPNYHFTITDDRVRFIRSNFLPIVYADIEPGMLHAYRLELYGSQSYIWSIDGQVIDSGIPQGSFLESDPMLIWGVRRFEFDHTTRWDYIRYGAIPEPASGALLLLGCMLLIRHRRRHRSLRLR